MLLAVTEVPLEVMAAFHEFVMAWLPPHVQVAFQVLVATVPGLLTVTVAVKPLPHWLSTCRLAEQRAAPPEPLGVEVAVRVGVGVARVRVGVGVAPVRVGVGVGPPLPETVAEKLETARPTPLTHGSKPFWMLVKYQELVPYCEPWVSALLMKSNTL